MQTFTATDGVNADAFGLTRGCLSMSGDGQTIAVGAYTNDGFGAAYVFSYNGTTWIQTAKLRLTPLTTSSSFFGYSVALTKAGDVLLVGAPGRYGSMGTVAVMQKTTSVWELKQTLVPSTGESNNVFGQGAIAVSDTGAVAVVGAPQWRSTSGSAYLFS